jgi:hypothetical protein
MPQPGAGSRPRPTRSLGAASLLLDCVEERGHTHGGRMLKNQTERPTPAAARTETPGARRPARVPRDAPGSSGGGQREGRPGALTAGCLLTGLGPRGFMVSGRQVRNATSAGSFFLCSSAIAVSSLDSCHEPPRAARLVADHAGGPAR